MRARFCGLCSAARLLSAPATAREFSALCTAWVRAWVLACERTVLELSRLLGVTVPVASCPRRLELVFGLLRPANERLLRLPETEREALRFSDRKL